MTANGKVDKKALQAMATQGNADTDTLAQTDVERQLQQLWGDLLGTDSSKVSMAANFFELGGDSILSIQLVARAAKQGLHFSAKDLFEAGNIRSLASRVKTGAETDRRTAAC